MNPRWLMPVLALLFAVLALCRLVKVGRIDPATRTWGLLAMLFAMVWAWLQWQLP